MIDAVPDAQLDAIDLDHIAVAAWQLDDLWPCYVSELGGEPADGGPSPGFDWAQVTYANGMRVEGLQPARVEEFDFLQRFLDRHGPGAHHITFKVPDLGDALGALGRAGVAPARVDRSNPGWQEAFLFPADAWGIVVQLAQPGDDEAVEDLPPGFPGPAGYVRRGVEAARLDRIVLDVTDLAAARRTYELLGGSVIDHGRAAAGAWVEVGWPGAGRVRLQEPGPEEPIPSGRTGRLHHLAFTVSDPSSIRGAVPDGDVAEVAPEANLGVRLRITPS
jgi:catechol 2,3-dioxygenase-like lactoylglutathione lyase family enzyme